MKTKFIMSIVMLLGSLPAFAVNGPNGFNYEGRLYDIQGNPSAQTVQFVLTIYNPAGTCLLRTEQTAPINLSQTGGYFSVTVGQGTPLAADPGLSVQAIFSNQGLITGGASCAYTPIAGDGRILRVSVNDGQTVTAMSPDIAIGSTPYATVADTADSVQGKHAVDFIQVNTAGPAVSQANLEAVFASPTNVTELVSLASGTSTKYMKSNATSGTVVPGLASAPGSPVSGQFWYDSTTHQLKFYDGSATQTLGTGGGGSVTTVTGTAPISVATGTTTPVVSITQATGATNGYLSSTDWTTFNSKLGSALTDGNILVGNASNVAMPVIPSGDASMTNAGVVTVSKVQGRAVGATAPAAGQVLRWDGATTWAPNYLSLADIRSTITPANTIFPSSPCNTSQALSWTVLTDTFTCQNISLNLASGVTGVLPVAMGGTGSTTGSITGTSALNFSAGGSNQNVSLTPSGAGTIVMNGNVGVGTAAPVSTLGIEGTAAGGEISASTYNLSTAGTARFLARSLSGSLSLEAHGSADTWGGGAAARMPGSATIDFSGSNPLSISASGGGGSIRFFTSGMAAGNQRMVIDPAGNVGIGTSTPTSPLHVSSNINGPTTLISENLSTGTGAQAEFGAKNNLGSMTSIGTMGSNVTAGAPLGADTGYVLSSSAQGLNLATTFAGSSAIRFFTGGGVPSERMQIANNGNVGVGTNAPADPFTVVSTNTTTSGMSRGSSSQVSYSPASPAVSMTQVSGASNSVQTSSSNSNSNVSLVGSEGAAQVVGTATAFQVTGVSGAAANYSSNMSSSSAAGVGAAVVNNGGANLLYGYGFISSLSNVGNLTNYSGVQVNFQNTGTVTNAWGLYIGNMPGTITNKYGVYVTDASANNYFAGKVGIGTSTPSAELDVQGAGLSVGAMLVGGSPVQNMKICSGTGTAGSVTTTTPLNFSIPCTGASVGMMAYCTPTASPGVPTIGWTAMVSTANQVNINLTNTSAGSATAVTWKCLVAN